MSNDTFPGIFKATKPYDVWSSAMRSGGGIWKLWAFVTLIVALIAMAFGAFVIHTDRSESLRNSEERTKSIAQTLIAHGEASLEEASKILLAIEPLVRNWDFVEPQQGQRITEAMKVMMSGSPQISSVWVVDGTGANKVDSWSFPPKPVDASERPYFKAHLASLPDPVVLGDLQPGSFTGRVRFTFSRALRSADRSIRAVMVVGLYKDFYDRLYAEVANWPGARAGLYAKGGSVLGRVVAPTEAGAVFAAQIEAQIEKAPSGSAEIAEDGSARLVAWQASAKYPGIYAVASQTTEAALENWRRRSYALGLALLLGTVGFSGLTWFALRAAEARQQIAFTEALAREVHHRVKNSLQLIVTLLAMRSKRAADPALVASLQDAAKQVETIAVVHSLLQASNSLDRVDVASLIGQVCQQLDDSVDSLEKEVRFSQDCSVQAGPSQASSVAIMVNELVTNGLKYGRSVVDVHCRIEDDRLVISVEDDGPGLPDDYQTRDLRKRFGLNTVHRLARSLDGSLVARTVKGAQFTLRIPVESLSDQQTAVG